MAKAGWHLLVLILISSFGTGCGHREKAKENPAPSNAGVAETPREFVGDWLCHLAGGPLSVTYHFSENGTFSADFSNPTFPADFPRGHDTGTWSVAGGRLILKYAVGTVPLLGSSEIQSTIGLQVVLRNDEAKGMSEIQILMRMAPPGMQPGDPVDVSRFIGSWKHDLDRYSFAADGTFTWNTGKSQHSGRWEWKDGALVIREAPHPAGANEGLPGGGSSADRAGIPQPTETRFAVWALEGNTLTLGTENQQIVALGRM